MHERSCSWEDFGSENVNQSLRLLKSSEKYLYPTFPSFWAKLSQKKSILVKFEILGLLANTLTANYEYSCSNNDNLPVPFQMQLSGKLKRFFTFFLAFPESALNIQHFEKKEKLHSSSIFEVNDSQRHVYLNAWNVLFLETFLQWMC